MKGMEGMAEESIDDRVLDAMRLYRADKLEELDPLLMSLVEDVPDDDAPLLGLVAGYLRRVGRHEESLAIFERLLEEDPSSERASMGVFHGLWKLQRYSEAFDELERYLTHWKGEQHIMLLLDWIEDFGDEIPDGLKEKFPGPEKATNKELLDLLSAMRYVLEPELIALKEK